MPLIGLLLFGMTFATGIMAGHLCVDIITALQEAADEVPQAPGDASAVAQDPVWRDRLLAPWADDVRPAEPALTRQNVASPPAER